MSYSYVRKKGNRISKILILEDDLGLAGILQRFIQKMAPNCAVDIAPNLKNARARINETRYNLFLLDMNLPDGYGFDLLSELPKPSITIGMSGQIIENHIQKRFRAFLEKPFSVSALRPFLEELKNESL